ncbi:MAG: fasciclin domain-containing protein [Chitinophagaceae bacterium]
MKRLKLCALLLFFLSGINTLCAQEKTITVGGAEMYPSRNIVQNISNSEDHTVLIEAVKAAGLTETLQSAGPFTVFAPTNKAFNMLPGGTVNNLLKPENKDVLTGILAYHVVAGNLDSKELECLVKEGKGTAELTTVQGGKLVVTMKKNKMLLKDEKGGVAAIIIKDVYQSNGVIHVIDHVVLHQ